MYYYLLINKPGRPRFFHYLKNHSKNNKNKQKEEVEQVEQRSSRKQQQQQQQEEIAKNEEVKQSSKMTTTPIAKYSGESGANTPRESSGGHREDFRSSSEFYELSKNSKRWRSMYALRDSIRNLTACVSTKSSHFSSSNKLVFIVYKKKRLYKHLKYILMNRSGLD